MTSDPSNSGEQDGDRPVDLDPDQQEPQPDSEHDADSSRDATESADHDGNEEEKQDDAEDVVPALDPDVYRKPFAEYDASDPEGIAAALEDINEDAASRVKELYRVNQKLEKQVAHLREKATEAHQELQEFRRRKNDETEEIKETATKDFIKDALPIRDNLTRALEQDSDEIRSGIELIKDDFDELLEHEGVEIIDPVGGDAVNPEVHEVMTRVESTHPPGKIHECFRPGYRMEDYVIRPARVTVSGENNS